MADHSKLINRDNDLLSAMVDPQYTPLEIFQYWQEIAADFPYLGAVPLKEDELSWDHQHRIAVTKDAAPITVPQPEVRLSGDSEVLDGYFGLPMYRPGIAEATEWILAFMTAERKPAFPIELSVTRNIVYEQPYSTLSIRIDPGTWGSRHPQFKAIEKVFRSLQRVADFADDNQTIAAAGTLAHRLQAWETGEVDFDRIRQQLWSAANRLVERFSNRQPPQDLPMYAADDFEHAVWIEQLQWWEDTPARKRGIAYWTANKTTEQWDRFYDACMGAVKGAWPSLVEVLTQPPVSPMDMARLITFLQDINWPGAFEALDFLQRQGPAAIQYLDDAIEDATRTNEGPWLEMLQYARGILSED